MDVLAHEDSTGKNKQADIAMCRRIVNVLFQHYPRHVWHVTVDSRPHVGTAEIKLLYTDHLGVLPRLGYRLHLNKITDRKIMRAGGELLERYRIARGQANEYARYDIITNGIDRAGEIK